MKESGAGEKELLEEVKAYPDRVSSKAANRNSCFATTDRKFLPVAFIQVNCRKDSVFFKNSYFMLTMQILRQVLLFKK